MSVERIVIAAFHGNLRIYQAMSLFFVVAVASTSACAF